MYLNGGIKAPGFDKWEKTFGTERGFLDAVQEGVLGFMAEPRTHKVTVKDGMTFFERI